MKNQLILFDCDGTLVDSQHMIVEAMEIAFKACHLPPPKREKTLSIVGLSLPYAITHIIDGDDVLINKISDSYKNAYHSLRLKNASEPLYEGMKALILKLKGYTMGVATGKNMRGLKHVLAMHELDSHFVTLQTADGNRSKPHPDMIHKAMLETGLTNVIMIGDTTYDIEMAVNAGAKAIGVSWGYHTIEQLIDAGAHIIVNSSDELYAAIVKISKE